MNPVDRILSALRKRGHEPKRVGNGWTCRCPAHDDRNPSLSIDAGDDGRALLNCHAGCSVDAVCGALAIAKADLFPDRGHGYMRGMLKRVSPSPKPTGKRKARGSGDGDGQTFATAREAVVELERRHGPRSATWTYHDAGGGPVGLMVRWNIPADPTDPESKPSKRILPVSKTPKGWAVVGMPTPRPLYGLPELLATPAAAWVFIVEGEKAADAARTVGLLATTSPHGSMSAAKADWSPVAGRDVVILPDHDDAGERYADDVARLATAAGAKSVRIVRLVELWAGMPEGGDIVDLIEHRGGDVDAIRAEVEALANTTEPEAATHHAPAVPTYTPFPVDVLPEPIRSFVAAGAKAIGCDASYVALPLLAGLAAAIGNTHRIALKCGWTERAIVWTAIVGESGTAKSPALELALRPIRKRQHDAMKEHAEAMKQHADVLAMHERDAAHWRKSKSDTPPPAKPEAPIADRCWTDDATTEALAVLLQQNPRGLLMVRDELAGWFNFDRYAGARAAGTRRSGWKCSAVARWWWIARRAARCTFPARRCRSPAASNRKPCGGRWGRNTGITGWRRGCC
jgi:Protein of unknown function (DUF3987)